jgi:hypothetical protein
VFHSGRSRIQTWVSAVLSRTTIQGAEAVEGGVVAANSIVSPVRPILWRDAGSYLNAVTEIPAKLNGLEHHFVAGSKNWTCEPRLTGINAVAGSRKATP